MFGTFFLNKLENFFDTSHSYDILFDMRRLLLYLVIFCSSMKETNVFLS